jgi:hypothetical protein
VLDTYSDGINPSTVFALPRSPGHPARRGASGEPNGGPRAPHKPVPRNKNVRGARARRDARPIARSLGCRTSDRGRRRLRKDASASSRVTWATNKRSLDRTTLAPARDPAEPPGPRRGIAARRTPVSESYLVDPASSHMLVSKIKPCMCKYELIQTVKLRMAH